MSTTYNYISGVRTLDGSQWKDDINLLKLVTVSINMYHWDIWCLDMVKTATINYEDQTTVNQPDVSTTCTSDVRTLDGSQWNDDINHLKVVTGSMSMYNWEWQCFDMVKEDTTQKWGPNYSKLTWCYYYIHF